MVHFGLPTAKSTAMTLTFPKNTAVTLKSHNNLGDFIRAITQTIVNHNNYVDDDATTNRWTDLVCNGIITESTITVTTLARMLEFTDQEDMNKMGPVVQLLFQELPVLYNYWDLVKVNVKSVQVRRLHVIDNSKLLAKITKQNEKKTKVLTQQKIQTTLTKHAAKKTETTNIPSQDDDHKSTFDNFTTPKRTVPVTKPSLPIDTVTVTNNSFAHLAEDIATETSQDNENTMQSSAPPKKDSPNESSSSSNPFITKQPALIISQDWYDKISLMIGQKKQDELSIDTIVNWIDSKVDLQTEMLLSEKEVLKNLSESLVENQVDIINQMKIKISRIIDNECHIMKSEIQSTGTESQLHVMTQINKESKALLKEYDDSRDKLKNSADIFKAQLENNLAMHQEELHRIHDDFKIQCKDYLNDHMVHRREVFTNQKAQFQKDINSMKEDMDKYLAKVHSIQKTSQPDTHHTTYTPSSPYHPSSSSNLHQTPKVQNAVPDDINSTHPAQVIPNNTIVSISAEDIHISRATVRGHFYDNEQLMYEVTTQKSKFTFPSSYVSTVTDQDDGASHHSRHMHYSSTTMKGDISVTSNYTHEGHDRHQHHRSRVLMPNQFRIKGQPDSHNIQTTTMLRHAANWDLEWKDTTIDPKDFYEDLKSNVEYYGIWMKGYMQLNRDDDICSINPSHCENYDNAHLSMSKALFTLLSKYKKDWFDTNPKMDLLLHYEDERDGFQFIKELLKDYHPNLKEKAKSETMDKPQLEDFDSWFRFMKQYRRWVNFERTSAAQREYTDHEHVSNILKQIKDIDVFAVAYESIHSKMTKVDENLIPFPADYKLHQIGLTIHNLLPEDAKNSLPTYNGITKRIINRVNTRSNSKDTYTSNSRNSHTSSSGQRRTPNSSLYRRDSSSFRQDKDKQDGVNRQWKDVTCPACGKPGHHIDEDGCDSMAINLNLQNYRRDKKSDFDKQSVIDIFTQHQKEKRNKKISGEKKRNMLRRQLRLAKVQMEYNDNEYKEAKHYYIKAFKDQHKDVELTDPRANHLEDIKEYDVLESEPESDEESDE